MKRTIIITFIISVMLHSCYSIIDVEIQNMDDKTYPYVEMVYYTNEGWKTTYSTTKTFGKLNNNPIEVEHITLYEEGVEVYTGNDTLLNFKPKPSKNYSLRIKLKGFPEMKSDSQKFQPGPSIDTCLVLENVISCSWTNDDSKAGYFVNHFSPGTLPQWKRYPDIIGSQSEDLPENLHYTYEKPYRDTVSYVVLNRLSESLIQFYESIYEYNQSFDDGTSDPPVIYTNMDYGFGVFGFVSQSDTAVVRW